MKRPAKSATKGKWIEYADALESSIALAWAAPAGTDARTDALEAKIEELERLAESRRRHVHQLKRKLGAASSRAS